MFFFKINKVFRNNYFLIITIFLVTHFFNFYQNIYIILKRNYEERMTLSYGYCERESYGFLKKAYEITESKHLKVINFEEYLWPPINGLFQIVGKEQDDRFIVLLNLKKFEDKTYVTYLNNKIFLDKKKIIFQDSNCYILKND